MSFVKFYDGNRLRKTYPFSRLRPVQTKINGASSQFDVDIEVAKLNFSNESSKTYEFDSSIDYIRIPVVGATVEDENVTVYITNLSTTSVTIESSSQFTGIVHLQIFKDN